MEINMKTLTKLVAVSLLALTLQACGEDSKMENVFMDNCKKAMSEDKCECQMNVYKDAGINMSDFADPSKATAAAQKLSTDDAQKLAKCMM